MKYIETIQSALLRKEQGVFKPKEMEVVLEHLLKETQRK